MRRRTTTSCRSSAWRDASVSLQQISRPASASSRKWTSRAALWMRSRSLCRRKSSAISHSCSAALMWRISGPVFISASMHWKTGISTMISAAVRCRNSSMLLRWKALASPITTAEQLQPVRCSSICTRHRNRICLT